MRAPDHAGLRPWLFICIQDAVRVRLGGALATTFMCRNRPATREQMQREHMRAKIIDQQLAAAPAAMNLLNAAHILGYGGMWLTGESCFDANVKRALGLAPDDFIAGWLYLGTPSSNLAPAWRPTADEVLRHWTGLPG